jgi:hypothetical protein
MYRREQDLGSKPSPPPLAAEIKPLEKCVIIFSCLLVKPFEICPLKLVVLVDKDDTVLVVWTVLNGRTPAHMPYIITPLEHQ